MVSLSFMAHVACHKQQHQGSITFLVCDIHVSTSFQQSLNERKVVIGEYNGRENLDTKTGENKLDSRRHEKTTLARIQSQSRPRNSQGREAAQPDRCRV